MAGPLCMSIRVALDGVEVDGPRRQQLADAVDVTVELLRAVRRVRDRQPAEIQADDATEDRADDRAARPR